MLTAFFLYAACAPLCAVANDEIQNRLDGNDSCEREPELEMHVVPRCS